MPGTEKAPASGLYAALMEEVKIRLSSIDSALAGRMDLPSPIVREFCFLQLRMLCELIALACLRAHGDIKETTRLRKEYSAAKIIERLERLHPEFFPQPIRLKRTGPGTHTADEVKTGFLTKGKLLTLYGRCGDVLHRGSLKRLISPRTTTQTSFPDIAAWRRGIEALLCQHFIQFSDEKVRMICTLRTIEDSNRVQVVIASTDPPQRPPA